MNVEMITKKNTHILWDNRLLSYHIKTKKSKLSFAFAGTERVRFPFDMKYLDSQQVNDEEQQRPGDLLKHIGAVTSDRIHVIHAWDPCLTTTSEQSMKKPSDLWQSDAQGVRHTVYSQDKGVFIRILLDDVVIHVHKDPGEDETSDKISFGVLLSGF